jgi:hypothetical protein
MHPCQSCGQCVGRDEGALGDIGKAVARAKDMAMGIAGGRQLCLGGRVSASGPGMGDTLTTVQSLNLQQRGCKG